MVLSYYNKFDDFSIKNTNPRLYCLLLTPLLFIGNNKLLPLLPVISSAFSIFLVYNLSLFNENENKEDEEASDEEASHEETSDEEDDDEETSDEEDDDEEASDEEDEEEAQASDEEEDSNCLNCNCNKEYINNDNNCKEEKNGDCYLIILTVKNTTQQFILTTTNELITTYKSKLIELGSIKLDSTNINLIVLEIDVSEDDIEQIKQDNELYDYATFDDTLNILEDVKLECIWRRYKHILSENEYKDNTYTIL
jgi:hypothetical protein